MSRRGSRSDTLGPGKPSRQGAIPRVYEGSDVLSSLLSQAGSRFDAASCRDFFAKAQKDGLSTSDVIPSLFPSEPRFSAPEGAIRLYGNLFGLWDQVAAGKAEAPQAAPPPTDSAPQEKPQPVQGEHADASFVESAWRYLADLPERDMARLRDRYEETQPQLAEFVREESPQSESGADTADAIAFECWAIYEMAFGPAPRRAGLARLKQIRASPPEPQEAAIGAYVQECLNEAEMDEQQPISQEERTSIEGIEKAVLAALEELRRSASHN